MIAARMSHCVWSTTRLHGALSQAHVSTFRTAWGLVGQGYSHPVHYSETSVCSTPLGFDFDVSSVSWVVYGGTADQRQGVVDNAAWRWEFIQTVYDGAPLVTRDLPSPGEIPEPPDQPRDGGEAEAAVFRALYSDDARVHGRVNLDEPLRLFNDCLWAIDVLFGRGAPTITDGEVYLKFILRGVAYVWR